MMYDQTALDAVWDLCKDWTAEQREALRVAASVDGLQAKVDGINMHDVAREVVAISHAGLKARAKPGAGGMVADETHFLNALHETIETGKTPADELMDHYNGDWNGDLKRVYSGFSY
jgi:glutamate--cysteine ligase